MIDRYRECGRPDKGSGVGSHGVAMVIGVVTVSVVIRRAGVVRVVLCYCRLTVEIYVLVYCMTVFVGPCHHGMARPQVADGGTASDMEGSYE